MGKVHSKAHKKIKPNSKLLESINCPYCNELFTTKSTFEMVNEHLKECGKDKQVDEQKLLNVSNNILNQLEKYTKSTKEASPGSPPINPTKIRNDNLFNDFEIENRSKSKSLTKHNTVSTINTSKAHKLLSSHIKTNLSQYKKTKCKLIAKDLEDLFSQMRRANIFFNTLDIIVNEEKFKNGLSDFIEKYMEYHLSKNYFSKINGKSIAFDFNIKEGMDYFLLGKCIAIIIIYPNIIFNYKFPHLVSKILLDTQIELPDLQYFNKDLYSELNKLKGLGYDIVNQNLFFSVDSEDLIENGSQIKVDDNNINEYTDLRSKYELKKNNDKIKLIQRGFYEIIPKEIITNFEWKELYNLINRLTKI
ncbi:MAG: HECT domain-containing protein [archaeon]|nr:HECT domain-containing protein [archaeon]